MTVNYSIIVSCSAHFPPGGRNLESTTDRVIADSRYSESRYSEVRLYYVYIFGVNKHFRLQFTSDSEEIEVVNMAEEKEIHDRTQKERFL